MEGLSWQQGSSEWITCPYDTNHKMPLETLQWHIAKVHKYARIRKDMASCPYNINHIMDYSKLNEHVQTCPSKWDQKYYSTQENEHEQGKKHDHEEENLRYGDCNQLVPFVEKVEKGAGDSQVHVHTHVHNHYHYTKLDELDSNHRLQARSSLSSPELASEPRFAAEQQTSLRQTYPRNEGGWSPSPREEEASQPQPCSRKNNQPAPSPQFYKPQPQPQPQTNPWVDLKPAVPSWTITYEGKILRHQASAFKPKTKDWHVRESELVRRMMKVTVQPHQTPQRQPPPTLPIQSPQQQISWYQESQWEQPPQTQLDKLQQCDQPQQNKRDAPPQNQLNQAPQSQWYQSSLQNQWNQSPLQNQWNQAPQRDLWDLPQNPWKQTTEKRYSQKKKQLPPRLQNHKQGSPQLPQTQSQQVQQIRHVPQIQPQQSQQTTQSNQDKLQERIEYLEDLRVNHQHALDLQLISLTDTGTLSEMEQWYVANINAMIEEIKKVEEEIEREKNIN